MAFPLFSDLKQRYLDLIGDSDGTIDDFGKRNINAAVKDVLNRYSFSWNKDTADITTASGVADMPNDFNPRWEIDARDADGNVFTQIPLYDRDSYDDEKVYWITPDVSNDKYIFNSPVDTTITLFYNFVPTALSSDSDKCAVPDLEAVAYLAASKNWIGAERDQELARNYQEMADRYINALYFRDLQNGPQEFEGNLASYNLG